MVNKETDVKYLSDRAEKYRAFWQPLVDTLREDHEFTGAMKGGSKNWKSFPAPSLPVGISYRVVFAGSGQVMVNLYIERKDKDRSSWNENKEWNERLFDQLENHKEDIESKLGESLSWDRMDGSDGGEPRMACRIAVYQPGTIYDDPERMGEICEWVIDRLLAFDRVFGPELERLLKLGTRRRPVNRR